MRSSPIKDFPTSDEARSKIVLREVCAHIAMGALYPFGLRSEFRRTKRANNQRTVVFVHGYFANRASFLPLHSYLRLRGMRSILSFDYSAKVSIERAARNLRDFLKARVRGGRIDLVCHSLGGVVARFYIQNLGGARRVDRCITLGTPHGGTYNSYWVPSQVGCDLKPDSRFLEKLRSSHSKSWNVKFTSLVGGSDNIVIPRVFAMEGKDTIHVPNTGHLGLLFSPAAFRFVYNRLNNE